MIISIWLIFYFVHFDSLEMAIYVTNPGVIQALYAEGILERAYCSETHPFNQVGT